MWFFNKNHSTSQRYRNTQSHIISIMPYKLTHADYVGGWVFDDERVGLFREAFVAGADLIIDDLVQHIPNAHLGFEMSFSARPFPGYEHTFTWVREEYGGNWYRTENGAKEGWLCPALFKYFRNTPKHIYVRVKPVRL